MRLSRRRGQVTHVLLTRSPLIHTHHKGRRFTVRLACVKHAASVRPEPGSNSPNKTNKNPNQPHTTSTEPARATVRKSPENQTTWPHPTPTTEARQTKTKQAPKNHTKRAAPQDPWHKKHDTLSSSQTTHPARSHRSLTASTRPGEQLRYCRGPTVPTSSRRPLPSITPAGDPLLRIAAAWVSPEARPVRQRAVL